MSYKPTAEQGWHQAGHMKGASEPSFIDGIHPSGPTPYIVNKHALEDAKGIEMQRAVMALQVRNLEAFEVLRNRRQRSIDAVEGALSSHNKLVLAADNPHG